MFPQQSKVPSVPVAIGLLMALVTPTSGLAADPPKPTPQPGTLGAYARTITLDRSALSDSSGRVILTNDTVAGIADGRTITLGAVPSAGPRSSSASGHGGGSTRARWRAAHQRQQRVITDLERQLSLLEIEIDHLEKQQLTPKILARLDRVESKRQHLEQQTARAREELARIVRDARRQGAEPGWFR